MDIKVSDIVVSRAGHDKGKLFYVVAAEPDYVYIANGKQGRTIESPKRKKLMHIQFIKRDGGQTADKLRNGETVNNIELRRSLAILRDEFLLRNQGG